MSATIKAFAEGLPKAELHVHLEGTIEPELMFAIAKRNDRALPWSSPDELRDAYAFTDLTDFLTAYFAGCEVLRTRQDFYDVTFAYLERAAADNVLRAEMHFGPQSFLANGVEIAEQLPGILDAIADARQAWSINGALIVSAHRHRANHDALDLLEIVEPWSSAIVGCGLGGAEMGNPPDKFVGYFAEARRRGYRTTAHAGEEGPASYVRDAIEICGVDRIDHGVAGILDEHVLDVLADRAIPITMCPISNLRLNVINSLADHPLRRALSRGVIASVNSDDPSYFGGYINDNFTAVQAALELDKHQLVSLALNGFLGSFASDADIRAGVDEIETYARDTAAHSRTSPE